jgi:hypothetical protein
MENNKIKILKGVSYFALFCIILVGLTAIIGTGGGDGESNTGRLSLGLIDAATDDFQAVYVTIQDVAVHKSGANSASWITVASPEKTYNLLELVNGVMEQLGLTELDTAHYTQLRLLLGDTPSGTTNILGNPHPYANYVIDYSGVTTELKVPSGYQTGIKLVHGFDITAGVTTELVLDFDATKSIVSAGNSGKILLKPTIKVLDALTSPVISGTVMTGVTGLSGVYISAQVYDPDTADPEDEVTVSTGTISGVSGNYSLTLDPGTYNLVAYKDGYDPVCSGITTEINSTYNQDLDLTASAVTGIISGTVSIKEGNEQIATLSFRQTAECGADGGAQIEIKWVSVASGGTYSESLPEGTYSVVASTENRDTQAHEVSTGSVLNIDF